MPTLRIWTIVSSAIVLLTVADLIPAQDRAPKQEYNSGEYLYRTFCASCHGESGRGDGPAARTLPHPATDLTLLAIRAGGMFPRDEITRIIDGRDAVPAHDTPDMPRWGKVLRQLEGDERATQRRIEALVKQLESIQRK